jgi:hypothetical protein
VTQWLVEEAAFAALELAEARERERELVELGRREQLQAMAARAAGMSDGLR